MGMITVKPDRLQELGNYQLDPGTYELKGLLDGVYVQKQATSLQGVKRGKGEARCEGKRSHQRLPGGAPNDPPFLSTCKWASRKSFLWAF